MQRERSDLEDAKDANAMWGWIAASVVLAFILLFVFVQGN